MSSKKKEIVGTLYVHAICIVAALGLAVSIIVLLAFFNISSAFSDMEKTAAFWSVIVTVTGLVVTVFFVVLAIIAYDKFHGIVVLRDQIEKQLDSLEQARGCLAESMSDSYTNQIALLYRLGKAGNLAIGILHSRGKLAYLFPTLDENTRIRYFFDLGTVGTGEDVVPLQKIANDKTETEEIREYAKNAIQMIRARYP